MKAKKLSWAMQNVVDFMSIGYALEDQFWSGSKLVSAEESKSISFNTIRALLRRGLIQMDRTTHRPSGRAAVYTLTPEGRKAVTP